MLIHHHGGAILGKFMARSILIATVSVSSPSFSVSEENARALRVSVDLRPTMARSIHHGQNQAWTPAHGIHFGSSSSFVETNTPPAMNRSRTSNPGYNVHIKSNAVGVCLVESTPSLSPCVSHHARLPSSGKLSIRCSSVRETSKSHDSKVGALGGNDALRDDISPEHCHESHTPLAYQIPQEILQKAKDALPGTKESFWSYKMYLGPEKQAVKVHYCRSKNTSESVAQYFLNEEVLGFDIEWKLEATKNSGIKNNVALIQIASESRIALFHIAAFPKDTVSELIAPTLKKIMENAEITKVGVAIKADCTRLRNFLNIDSRGILELSHLYKLVKYSSSGDLRQINKRLVSLNTQVEEHLALPIFKGEVRCSDWTQSLSIEQIKYAATDAYANFMLYDALEFKRKQLRPVPPRPYHAELDLPIRLASGAVISIKEDVFDHLQTNQTYELGPQASPASVVEAAAENVQLEDETKPTFTKLKFKTPPTGSATRVPTILRPQLLLDADTWALSYRTSNTSTSSSGAPSQKVSFSALRAYALWYHNPYLPIQTIASMLRDPPLRNSTVAVYILDSVRLEKLSFEKEQLRKILQIVSDSQNMWRYKGLWKQVE